MHWIHPRTDAAHNNLLRAPGRARFDRTLVSFGQALGIYLLTAYHVSFIGVSYSETAYVDTDFVGMENTTLNTIDPLVSVEDSLPESDLQDDWSDRAGKYKYKHNVALALGNCMYHGTAACNYRSEQQMRVALSVFVASVHSGNVVSIMDTYKDVQTMADRSVLPYTLRLHHWKLNDLSIQLLKDLVVNELLHQPVEDCQVVPVVWTGTDQTLQ